MNAVCPVVANDAIRDRMIIRLVYIIRSAEEDAPGTCLPGGVVVSHKVAGYHAVFDGDRVSVV